MRIALTALTEQGPRDVVVNADDTATVADLSIALRDALAQRSGTGGLAEVVRLPGANWAAQAGASDANGSRVETAPRRVAELWLNGEPLDPAAPALTMLRDGDRVAFDRAAAVATVRGEPHGAVEIRVSGGPAAGPVHRLGFGEAILGTAPHCAVRVADPTVPPEAARVRVSPGETSLAPVNGAAMTLDGQQLTESVPWPAGGVLAIGTSVFTLHIPEAPDARLEPLPEGGLAYNRPPRLRPPERSRRLEVPAEPKRSTGQRLQLIAAFLPIPFAAAMIYFTKIWYFAMFALMSPLMIIGQWVGERRFGKKQYRKQMKEYRERKAAFESQLERITALDEAERRGAAPDPAELLLTATGPRRRLWERRITDTDTLKLRVGLADLPTNVELVRERGAGGDMELPEPPRSHAVPVSLAMSKLGVVGVTGPRPCARALVRWLIAQAAVLHSPRDLSIVVLSADPAAPEHWDWVRWLPHAWPPETDDCVALIGADPDSAARRVAELVATITERREAKGGAGFMGGAFGSATPAATFASALEQPHNVLVLLDGARALRALPGMPTVLRQGPPVGVFTIAIDDDQMLLPEECATVAVFDVDRPGHLRLRGGEMDMIGDVLADQVSTAWADRVGRAIAPIRDVSRDDAADAAIPTAARLLDLLEMPNPSPEQIGEIWQRFGRTTSAPIGVSADGPFGVDLRVDGPHGLVAGTTGAGKSELLQTLISSLAVANRPDEMNFVLIDYKGGAAFADCAKLPHTVGMVSDLDGHLTERALESLAAELRRRERLLRRAEAKDIEDYNELRDRGEDLPPMPRLVLIIDEFAAMVAELPDFVTGLVDIARRGRSLGVHLLLATQRPAGVVTADIQANTNLRIALRVTDGTESTDVIGVTDAAKISKSTPGRCYVRSGAAAPVAVQSARIGGRRPTAGAAAADAPYVVPIGWNQLGRPLPARPRVDSGDDQAMITDLAVLVEAIGGAAKRLGIGRQPSPWLPPLDERVRLDELEVASYDPGRDEVPPLPYGLTDLPREQSRQPLTLDLAHSGHVVFAGASGTGRSTVLRTIAGSIARTASAEDVHVYALDCGSGSLLPLVAMPHCGAVVSRDQIERVDRLLARLRGEVARRQQLLATAGFASLTEARAAGKERLPWVVLMLDAWEGFVAAFEQYDYGRMIETLLQLLREGPAVGLRALITTNRSALVGQVSTVFDQRYLLRMADPNDASMVGISARSVPSTQPPGRVIAAGSSGVIESQIALLDPDPAGPAQVGALQALARGCEERHGRLPRERRPMRVDTLPIRVTSREVLALDPDFAPPSPLWALCGAGGDELGPRGVDLLAQGPGFVVAGPPRSGRSSALVTMAKSLLSRGTPVALVTPRRSPLRELAGEPGALGVLDGDAKPDDLRKLTEGRERYVVFVDDAELLTDTPIVPALEEVLRKGRDAEYGLVCAGSTSDLSGTYRGFTVEARKSRSGLLLSVQNPNDGDLLGVRLPRNAGGGPIGRGLLVLLGQVMAVQVAVPE